ncbi:MAG: phosphodiester glycosidase family protein [Verrucomicrobiales bacterium]
MPLNRDQPPQDSPEWGNFYLAPNGVFFIGPDGKAGVMETGEFARSGIKPMLAAQSTRSCCGAADPPEVPRGSPNKRVRNGVGVDSGGRVVFASTRSAAVNFHTFARMFAELGCADALFLDGDFPEILIKPEGDVPGKARRLAGIFYVAEPIPEEKGGAR